MPVCRKVVFLRGAGATSARMGDYVAGIDVGGKKKGYHLCLLAGQEIAMLAHALSEKEIIALLSAHLQHKKAQIPCISIDGPAASYRTSEKTRASEGALASMGYRVLYTPTDRPSEDHWMARSASLHAQLRKAFPGALLLETYPSAISDRLFGLEGVLPLSLLQEKRKRKYYLDYIDAILCAHAARQHLLGSSEILEDRGMDRRIHRPISLPTFPTTRATLSFLLRKNQVLLGLKKRGFGKGYWNGFGGKIEQGETPAQAAAREIQEECGLRAKNLESAGKLYFHFDDDPRRIEGFLFRTTDFSGKIVETAEMRPAWFSKSRLPFQSMWEDDRFWLPFILSGKKVHATFRFSGKNMQDYSIEILD